MSKKLEDNGRWGSSRMLPEHREQYLERRRQPETGKVPVPTKEELELIRDYVLLPMMLSLVERNRIEIELSSHKLKSLYVKAAELLMTRMHSDLAGVRKSLREHNIKVFEDERVDNAVHFRFVCRGYEDKFAMMRDVVRAEISLRIAKYIHVLFRQEAAK